MLAFRCELPFPLCNDKRLSFVLPNVEGLASALEMQVDGWRECVPSVQDRCRGFVNNS